jgi:sodium transport system ATP-binding protein
MIQAEALCKTFYDVKRGEIHAVDHVSFHCKSGQIFGLLGPNGAGKTTILRMLSTVLAPSSGKASILGYDVQQQAQEVRKRIGFLSGNTGIYDRMTPWEMVRYFGRLYGMEKEALNTRMETVFELLKMNDFRDKMNSKLSSGMKQKASIARTIIHDPQVMIFDEPTVALDIMVARTVIDFIEQIRSENRCIIFSTHIMSEAERLCQECCIIDKGKIVAQGSLPHLRTDSGQERLEDIFFHYVKKSELEVS